MVIEFAKKHSGIANPLRGATSTTQDVSNDALKKAVSELLGQANELPSGPSRTLLTEYLNHAIRLLNDDPLKMRIVARMGQIESRFKSPKGDTSALFGSLGDKAIELAKLIQSDQSIPGKEQLLNETKHILGDLSKCLGSNGSTLERRLGLSIPKVMVAAAAAFAAGFRGADLVIFTAIAGAESTYDPNNSTYGPTDNSHGLWQVNLKGSLKSRIPEICRLSGKDSAVEALHDPEFNAKYSKKLYDSKINRGLVARRFSDWSAYNHGRHRKYMGIAKIAVNQYLASIGEEVNT